MFLVRNYEPEDIFKALKENTMVNLGCYAHWKCLSKAKVNVHFFIQTKASRPPLQEMLKEFLQEEGEW